MMMKEHDLDEEGRRKSGHGGAPAGEPDEPRRAADLMTAALARPLSPKKEEPARCLLVDVARQEILLLKGGRVAARHPVSTASAGVGGEEGSLATPPGWHRVHAKIGKGAPEGTIFESRAATGEMWSGEEDARDLILTRVLTLEGLEDGVNRGPGRDSLQRFIYIHGTNHLGDLGRPASHGCVRMSSGDLVRLFDRVEVGDPVVVVEFAAAPAEFPDPRGPGRFHYAGVAGSGMSALAAFQAMSGGRVSGSDRAFDRGERPALRAFLEDLGITLYAQDGSGLNEGAAALVVSTAVETGVPDVATARAKGIPVVHRSELLAHFVRTHRTLAVTGTSGKSTVTAMLFEILRGAGRDPSVITGGEILSLRARGVWGNAWAGRGELLVIEADESDGSLVRYEASVGVILNLERDHLETSEVAAMFEAFAARASEAVVIGEGMKSRGFGGARATPRAATFGFGEGVDLRATGVTLRAGGSEFIAAGTRFSLPVPGLHNIENALAAVAAAAAVGVAAADAARALASFGGVSRRFETVGTARGVEVVDDFAHNPAKIAAAIAAARVRLGEPPRGRVLAVFQPHGYGPTRFLRHDLVRAFVAALGPEDRLWLLEIFYAGGTATRDISSRDLAGEISRERRCEFAPTREGLAASLAAEARAGDLILIMGARDPSLTDFAREVLAALAT